MLQDLGTESTLGAEAQPGLLPEVGAQGAAAK